MEIKYSNKFRDIFYAKLRSLYHNPLFWILHSIVILWLNYELIGKGANDWLVAKIITIILYNIFFLTILFLLNVLVVLLEVVLLVVRSPKGAVFSEHIIEFDEAKIREITIFNTSDWNWRGVHSVTQDKHYIYLLVTPERFYVIPKRVLGHTRANEVFQSMIQFYHNSKGINVLK